MTQSNRLALELSYLVKGVRTCLRFERGSVLIGRTPQCDVVLSASQVSREHARVSLDGDRWTLSDLGSSNGCFVNGERIQQRALADGDLISLGEYPLECRLIQGSGSDPVDFGISGEDLMVDSIIVDDFDGLLQSVLSDTPDTKAGARPSRKDDSRGGRQPTARSEALGNAASIIRFLKRATGRAAFKRRT